MLRVAKSSVACQFVKHVIYLCQEVRKHFGENGKNTNLFLGQHHLRHLRRRTDVPDALQCLFSPLLAYIWVRKIFPPIWTPPKIGRTLAHCEFCKLKSMSSTVQGLHLCRERAYSPWIIYRTTQRSIQGISYIAEVGVPPMPPQ